MRDTDPSLSHTHMGETHNFSACVCVHNQRAPTHVPSRTRLAAHSLILATCSPYVLAPTPHDAPLAYDRTRTLPPCTLPPRHGSARLGTARHSSAQLGTARHSSARLGTTRHNSARHSSARHASASPRESRDSKLWWEQGETQRCHHGCERNTLAVVMVTESSSWSRLTWWMSTILSTALKICSLMHTERGGCTRGASSSELNGVALFDVSSGGCSVVTAVVRLGTREYENTKTVVLLSVKIVGKGRRDGERQQSRRLDTRRRAPLGRGAATALVRRHGARNIRDARDARRGVVTTRVVSTSADM